MTSHITYFDGRSVRLASTIPASAYEADLRSRFAYGADAVRGREEGAATPARSDTTLQHISGPVNVFTAPSASADAEFAFVADVESAGIRVEPVVPEVPPHAADYVLMIVNDESVERVMRKEARTGHMTSAQKFKDSDDWVYITRGPVSEVLNPSLFLVAHREEDTGRLVFTPPEKANMPETQVIVTALTNRTDEPITVPTLIKAWRHMIKLVMMSEVVNGQKFDSASFVRKVEINMVSFPLLHHDSSINALLQAIFAEHDKIDDPRRNGTLNGFSVSHSILVPTMSTATWLGLRADLEKLQIEADKERVKCRVRTAAINLMSTRANNGYPLAIARLLDELVSETCDDDLGIETQTLSLDGEGSDVVQKMGLVLSVGGTAGAEDRGPVVWIGKYKGDNTRDSVTVLVGKGVTYDTGGYDLKGSKSMENMHFDKTGAIVACAVLRAAAELKLDMNIVAVLPLAENAINRAASKPGDIVRSYSGKTVEINNTDAEGRLIMADAISYAVDKYPRIDQIITIATLTGAVRTALGNHIAALFRQGYTDEHFKMFVGIGELLNERIHPLPLPRDLRRTLLSPGEADLTNVAPDGTGAGAITAAGFLSHFTGRTVPWLHFDIAGVAVKNKEKKKPSGFGVRLITDLLEIVKL